MQIHQIKPKHKLKKKKRIGRGGKRGTYSGKGIKGQRSRAGRKFAPIIRELIKKYPKLRGYRNQSKQKKVAIINIGDLNDFTSTEIINPKSLIKKRLVRRIKGRIPKVKILGRGEVTKTLKIEGCEFSKTAKEKLEKYAK